jgi:glycosyltransferase involved in cell wall biosynthesis
MRISVVICSVGRPESIAAILPWISRQTHKPTEVVLVVTKEADLPPKHKLEIGLPVEVIFSEKGLPKQRNRGLVAVHERCDAVFFIDDDYMPSKTALEGIAHSFATFPSAVGVTGRLLADGIHTGGVSFDEAGEMIEAYERGEGARTKAPKALKRNLVGLYGCNMAYRLDKIGVTWFDERLPLYGWQEDVDFASRVRGEKIKSDALVGVHCGVKGGRETSGRLLGYSQVANPAYLIAKGSLPAGFAIKLMARNVIANHLKSLKPEPWIDRRGRVRGNWLALVDLLRGRSHPERILDMMKG